MRPTLVALIHRWGLGSTDFLVPTAGFIAALTFVVCGVALMRRARQAGLPVTQAANLWILAGASGIVGGHLFSLLTNRGVAHLSFRALLSTAGLSSWGAYLGAVIAVLLYCVIAKAPLLRWVDVAASVAPLFEVVGRWSCWLAGDDFGRVSSMPWAIRFPAGSFAWQAQVARGEIPSTAAASLPVHPEQFYLMISALAVFLVGSAIWRRRRDQPGVTVVACVGLYGAFRFVAEFWRDPAAGGAVTGLSSPQWMCLAFVVAGMALYLFRRRYATA